MLIRVDRRKQCDKKREGGLAVFKWCNPRHVTNLGQSAELWAAEKMVDQYGIMGMMYSVLTVCLNFLLSATRLCCYRQLPWLFDGCKWNHHKKLKNHATTNKQMVHILLSLVCTVLLILPIGVRPSALKQVGDEKQTLINNQIASIVCPYLLRTNNACTTLVRDAMLPIQLF